MFDLEPATAALTTIVQGVRDDQLGAPTPCQDMTVADLLDHVDTFAQALAAAAAKADVGQPPPVDGARLGTDWRARIPRRLTELAGAWRVEAAWAGVASAGGLELPGEAWGAVTVDELIVHGWDLAVATGQTFTWDPRLAEVAYGFVQPTAARSPEGVPGLFGAAVPVPADAPLLDRLLGLTGRDPAWQARDPAGTRDD